MKRVILVIASVILVSIGVFFIFSNKQDNQQVVANETTIAKINSEGSQLIDVRTPEEYQTSHADQAVNIPLDDIESGDFSKIDVNKPIYLYCRSGNRASQAKIILEQNGFDDVTNLGGLADLSSDGGKVCSSAKPAC